MNAKIGRDLPEWPARASGSRVESRAGGYLEPQPQSAPALAVNGSKFPAIGAPSSRTGSELLRSTVTVALPSCFVFPATELHKTTGHAVLNLKQVSHA